MPPRHFIHFSHTKNPAIFICQILMSRILTLQYPLVTFRRHDLHLWNRFTIMHYSELVVNMQNTINHRSMIHFECTKLEVTLSTSSGFYHKILGWNPKYKLLLIQLVHAEKWLTVQVTRVWSTGWIMVLMNLPFRPLWLPWALWLWSRRHLKA